MYYNVVHSKENFIGDFKMTTNVLVQARIDKTIKHDAALVLKTIGLTVSDAVRLLLTRIAREKSLPFEPLVPNVETIAAMNELDANKGKKFNSVEDLMADLHAND